MDAHTQKIAEAFMEVLQAEASISRLEARKKRFEALYKLAKAKQEKRLERWAEIEKLMAESGEPEVVLSGTVTDYKIARGKGTEVVDAPDVEAVPPEWVKVEKSVKKKELLAHLKELRDTGAAMPNWASIKRNSGSLGWTAIKKG